MSEADVGGVAVEIEPSRQYSVKFCWCVTEEWPSDNVGSDRAVCMKWRSVTEFLHVEKIAPIDIHRRW